MIRAGNGDDGGNGKFTRGQRGKRGWNCLAFQTPFPPLPSCDLFPPFPPSSPFPTAYMRNTPNCGGGIGALYEAEIANASTARVFTGSRMPSSQSRAVE